jgi:hypothetical protein
MPHEIEDLERRGWDALSGSGGAAYYDRLMANDSLMVFPGMTLDKTATIHAIAEARPWSSHRLDDVRVVVGAATAVITYVATAVREGEPEYRARMSSVYARMDDRWQLLLHQQSPDPAT